MNNIRINDEKIQVKEYKGFKVVTFDDIDRVHKRPKGTAGRNFRQNKKHFLKDEDYYQVENQELKNLKQTTNFVGSNAKTLILLTQTGYLMLVKSFTDNLSWNVQRVLVNNYFNEKQPQQTQIQLPKPYKLIKKYYNGELVMDIEDLANIFNFSNCMMYYYIKKYEVYGIHLVNDELAKFKRENLNFKPNCSSLLVYDRDDVIDLTKFLNRIDKQNEVIKYFESDVKKTLPNINVYIPTEIQLKQADLLLKLTEDMDYDFKHFFRGYATYLVIGKEVYSQYEFAKKIKDFKSELQVIDKNELGEFIGQVKNDIEYKRLPIKAKRYMDKIYDEVLS